MGRTARVSRTSAYLETRKAEDGTVWVHDVVETPYGYVRVFAGDGYARLRFVAKGREHLRSYKGAWTVRGLAIAAGRLAREVSA
jgi:hypothetical protein